MLRTRVPSQGQQSCARPGPAHSGGLQAPPRTPARAAPPSPKAVALPTPVSATSPASPASPLGRAPTFAEVGRVAASRSSKHHVTKKPANDAWPSARQAEDCESQRAPRRGSGMEVGGGGAGKKTDSRRLARPKDASRDGAQFQVQ